MVLLNKKGFSLLEIVIAIALLGMVMISVCSVFAKGLEAIKKSQKNAAGLYIAEKKLDEVVNIDLSDSAGISKMKICTSVEGYDPGASTIVPDEFDPYISWGIASGTQNIAGSEVMGDIEYDFDITLEPYRQNLKKVSVKLSWFDFIRKEDKSLELHTYLSRKVFD